MTVCGGHSNQFSSCISGCPFEVSSCPGSWVSPDPLWAITSISLEVYSCWELACIPASHIWLIPRLKMHLQIHLFRMLHGTSNSRGLNLTSAEVPSLDASICTRLHPCNSSHDQLITSQSDLHLPWLYHQFSLGLPFKFLAFPPGRGFHQFPSPRHLPWFGRIYRRD